MHHVHGDGSSEEEREWEGASKVVRRPKPLADDLSMDDTGADKGEADLDVDTINLKEERPDETKRKADKYEADDDKDDSDERTDNDDQDASAEDPKDEEGIDEVTLKTFPVRMLGLEFAHLPSLSLLHWRNHEESAR